MHPNEQASVVHRLIAEHVRSPSFRHIRDPRMIAKLASEIVAMLDRGSSLWQKWDDRREALVRVAAPCWVPLERLTDYLNQMPGPRLTATDVAQRMRAVHEERFNSYPNEQLKEGCLALFRSEDTAGTELAAIVGALQEYVEAEEERLRVERQGAWRQHAEGSGWPWNSDFCLARTANGRLWTSPRNCTAASTDEPIGSRRRRTRCGTWIG